MKPEYKQPWIEALRSGQYKQGQSALCRQVDGNKQFCCLRVLLDINGEQWDQAAPDYHSNRFQPTSQSDTSYLSSDNCERFGLTREQQHKVADINDGEEGSTYTFTEIADYIERNF